MSKQNINTRPQLSRFITSVAVNDYASANKYLKSIIENKLLNKINTFRTKPLF